MFAKAVGLLNVTADQFWNMTLFEFSARLYHYYQKDQWQSYKLGVLAMCLAPELKGKKKSTPSDFFHIPIIEEMMKSEDSNNYFKELEFRFELVKQGHINLELAKNRHLKDELIEHGYITE